MSDPRDPAVSSAATGPPLSQHTTGGAAAGSVEPTELDTADAAALAHEIVDARRDQVVRAAIGRAGVARADALAADALAADVGARVPPARLPPAAARGADWRRVVRTAVERRMFTPEHLTRYARLLAQRLRRPHVRFEGMVFLGRGVELYARPGHGRLVLGAWSWIGDVNHLRAHEGNLRLAPKVVLGRANVVNAYLDVEIGRNALLGDWIYVCDFDHVYERADVPIKKQGIVKSPVRIGEDVWVGEKASILRGADIGAGSVVGSQTLVKGRIPPFSVVVGTPGRVLRSRLPAGMTAEEALALQRAGRAIPGDPLEG